MEIKIEKIFKSRRDETNFAIEFIYKNKNLLLIMNTGAYGDPDLFDSLDLNKKDLLKIKNIIEEGLKEEK